MTWVELALAFQTAIVGVVGFAGLIVTQWLNGCLIRRQHDRERRQNAEALKSSFLSELKMFQKAFIGQLDGAKKLKEQLSAAPQREKQLMFPLISRNVSVPLTKDIGLLTILGIDIDKTLSALISVDHIERTLRAIELEHALQAGKSRLDAQHFTLNSGTLDAFEAMLTVNDEILTSAIKELDRNSHAQLPRSANA
jgi:hypothetical protein